ncbi:hypothetical protein Ssi03_14670 [Sphaerisporangium siamense]|nr:hypothetical protein Ssi03_14670 [Sphaerisporangium siamense]
MGPRFLEKFPHASGRVVHVLPGDWDETKNIFGTGASRHEPGKARRGPAGREDVVRAERHARRERV